MQATDGRPYTHFSWFQLLNAKSAAPPYGICVSGSPKSVSFWGKGVNCAKHKRHVAPNSLVNLGETVQCTVS